MNKTKLFYHAYGSDYLKVASKLMASLMVQNVPLNSSWEAYSKASLDAADSFFWELENRVNTKQNP